MKIEIKKIIKDEFTSLIEKIEDDFSANLDKKNNNFLLCQMDKKTQANMVFVSSFESKSGNTLEQCAIKIARLKFGDHNVPLIVNPHNLNHNIDETKLKGQVVVTNVDIDNSDLRGKVASFRSKNMATGKGKFRIESKTTQSTIKSELFPLSFKYKTKFIYSKPVDLAFFDGFQWNICELKAGGDLDSSNAPSNVEKLLNIYVDMSLENCNVYFATLYNKNGEGNTWTGSVKKHLNYSSMFLIGSDFWNKILPEGLIFDDFVELYKETLNELDLNKIVNDLLDNHNEII